MILMVVGINSRSMDSNLLMEGRLRRVRMGVVLLSRGSRVLHLRDGRVGHRRVSIRRILIKGRLILSILRVRAMVVISRLSISMVLCVGF
jgi:hypothetical protein